MLNKKALAASLSAKETDADFKQTVLLLHGDGTNGAQNNTFTDSSTNAFSITRNGNTTQGTFSPFSQTGWSNYFDGSGDYLTVATAADSDLNLTGTFTIEFWFYRNATGNMWFFSKGGGTNNWNSTDGIAYQLFIEDGDVKAQFAIGSNSQITLSGTAPSVGTWNHFAVGRNGTTCRAWLNGTSIGSSTTSFSFPTTKNIIKIAANQSNGSVLNGYISNLRAVNGTDVYGVSNTSITVPTASLTAVTNTKLLTCQSNRFVDNSTNAYALTPSGDTSVQAFSPFAPTDAYSAATNGGSGYFDGSGDYLQNTSITNQFDVGSAFTLELWVYVTTYQEAGWVNTGGSTVDWNTTTGLYWSLYQYSGSLYLQTGQGNGLATNLITTTSPSANAWHHIAIGYNGTTTRMWIDGASVGTSTTSYFKPSGTDRIQVGAFTGGTAPFAGYFSGVRFVKGTDVYGAGNTTITIPTAPPTNISNTSLLCNFTNAGIIDQTGKNNLETVGDSQISNTTAKFGSTSIKFDGTGDWLLTRTSPNLDMGTGDLTIEGWFYLTTSPADYQMIVSDATNGNNYVSIRGGGTGGQIEVNVSGTSFRFNLNNSVSASTWFHLAVSRYNGTWYGFINGASLGSASGSGAFNLGNGGMYVGRFGGATAYAWPGYIDDLRITKGVARYTTNFTAPTKAFADQ